MALTDNNDPNTEIAQTIPHAALDRLKLLDVESLEAAGLVRFLAGAVNAAGALILLGMAMLTFAAGASLKSCFIWALLVLVGIGALLYSYIRSTAAFDRVPLNEAAQDLRAILLYAGFAWGAGAFLVLSPAAGPVTALAFAALPSLAVALLLADRDGPLAFVLPVTAMSLAATILQPWPNAGLDTALLLMLQSSIVARIILQGRRARRDLPAGLQLY
jgi:hypothetical protein